MVPAHKKNTYIANNHPPLPDPPAPVVPKKPQHKRAYEQSPQPVLTPAKVPPPPPVSPTDVTYQCNHLSVMVCVTVYATISVMVCVTVYVTISVVCVIVYVTISVSVYITISIVVCVTLRNYQRNGVCNYWCILCNCLCKCLCKC